MTAFRAVRSAEGKFAQQRLEMLSKAKKRALEETYERLHDLLRVPDRAPQFMPGGGDGFPPLPGKKDQ